jgi:hypothetical protein
MYICLYDTYDVNPYGYRSYGDTRPPRPPAVSSVVVKTYEMHKKEGHLSPSYISRHNLQGDRSNH